MLYAAFALGVAVRLGGAGAWLSHDEGYSWLVASAPDPGAFLSRLADYENTPPLFYVLLAPLPDGHEIWLRMPALIAGSLWVPVTYLIARELHGRQAGIGAAFIVAVAPFLVSYSDYSRGFMLAGLALLVALLATVRLLAGATRRWSWVFVAAATVALYSEYYSAFVLPLFGLALVLERTERWRRWCTVTLLPFLLFAPWAGQTLRQAGRLGETKLSAVPAQVSPTATRDALLSLFYGEHGAAGAVLLRWLQLLLLVAVVGGGLWVVRRHRVLGILLVGQLLTYLLWSALVSDVLQQRYLTFLVAVSAIVVAGALRRVWRVVMVAAIVAGAGLGAHRLGRQYEPDAPRAAAVALEAGVPVHTNSAVIAYYGRDGDVVLDRAFGLGTGTCTAGCAVVDDRRYGGVRPGLVPRLRVGPIVVALPTARG